MALARKAPRILIIEIPDDVPLGLTGIVQFKDGRGIRPGDARVRACTRITRIKDNRARIDDDNVRRRSRAPGRSRRNSHTRPFQYATN